MVLMPRSKCDGLAGGEETAKVLRELRCPMREAYRRGAQRMLDSGGQGERLADLRTAHLVEVADIDKGEIALEPQRAKDRQLGVVIVEPVDLVQGRFDRQRSVAIDGGCTAADVATLEHKHSGSAARIKGGRGQTPEARPDRDCVEVT